MHNVEAYMKSILEDYAISVGYWFRCLKADYKDLYFICDTTLYIKYDKESFADHDALIIFFNIVAKESERERERETY